MSHANVPNWAGRPLIVQRAGGARLLKGMVVEVVTVTVLVEVTVAAKVSQIMLMAVNAQGVKEQQEEQKLT